MLFFHLLFTSWDNMLCIHSIYTTAFTKLVNFARAGEGGNLLNELFARLKSIATIVHTAVTNCSSEILDKPRISIVRGATPNQKTSPPCETRHLRTTVPALLSRAHWSGGCILVAFCGNKHTREVGTRRRRKIFHATNERVINASGNG